MQETYFENITNIYPKNPVEKIAYTSCVKHKQTFGMFFSFFIAFFQYYIIGRGWVRPQPQFEIVVYVPNAFEIAVNRELRYK